MHKYLEIARVYMKTQLAWRADVIFNMIFTVTKILFAYLLWGLIFRERSMVGEFTFHGILSYYIVSSFLSQLEMSRSVSGEIHERIRNGTFSKYMIVPVNVEGYFIFMELGMIAFYFVFDLLAAVVWKFVFRIEFSFAGDPVAIVCGVLTAAVGLLFMVELNFWLGILTLKYQGIEAFLMIKNNLMELATGSIVPLALFPEIAVGVMRCLPFYYVTYLPAMLLTGQCGDEAVTGVAVIAAWCVGMQLVLAATWKKYIRKYDGVGI